MNQIKSILPKNFELILMLKYNRCRWDVKTVGKISTTILANDEDENPEIIELDMNDDDEEDEYDFDDVSEESEVEI